MKKARRNNLRTLLMSDIELPSSKLLLRIRFPHDSDLIRIWNAPRTPQPTESSTPKQKLSRSERQKMAVQGRALSERIESVHRRACEDGVNDLRALGITPSELMIHAYQFRLGRWDRIVDVSDAVLSTLFEDITKDAGPDLRRYLPVPASDSAQSRDPRTVVLPDDAFRRWKSGVRELLRARIIHEEALGCRKNYLLLSRTKNLPSRDVFFGSYFGLAQDRIIEAGQLSAQENEVILGTSAAEASSRHLETLRFHLEEVDLLLNPKESYLSLRSDPKKLGIWREIDFGLRQCFCPDVSHFAKSQCIAAAIMVYVGSPLFEPAPVRVFAQNIVEKWRLRARDQEGELEAAYELERERARRYRKFNSRLRRRHTNSNTPGRPPQTPPSR